MRDEILNLIADELIGEITQEGKLELSAWVNQCSENKKVYESYVRLFADIKGLKNHKLEVDEKLHLSIIKQKILQKQKRKVLVHRFMHAAAAVLLPAIIFIAVFYSSKMPTATNVNDYEILPGVQKAQLVLSTGEIVHLTDSVISISHLNDGVEIVNSNNKLSYSSSIKNSREVRFNTLIVSKGEEYQVVLDDGTIVWLNSESRLRYPVQFIETERKVELQGEAYFEVAHNAQKPFYVNTNEINVAVIGTSFNVSAYPNDETVHTTLLNGRVSVRNNFGESENKLLLPNQQFVYNKINHQVYVNEVNAEFFSSWKDGAFIFINESLSSIMKKIERWYNVKVFFRGQEVQNLRFSGKLKRFKTCNEVLEIISKTTHIQFEINEDNTIIIH